VSITTLLPGVDQHGAGFRVRLRFPGRTHPHTETGFTTPDAANARALELRALRDAGLTPAAAPVELTLRQAADALLARKRTTVSRKTKRRLRQTGIAWWERALRPWREGEFADMPLSLLRRDRVEDAILARVLAAPKSGRDELDALKATLRHAGGRGARFELALLEIERPALTPRKRVALDVADLELLAESAPAYAYRMLLFAGTVGNRVGELFTLADDRVDLAGAAIFIPEDLCKEGVDKWIELTGEEVTLLREQLLARPPSTPLVFPTKTGLTWAGRYGEFHKLVWAKACRRAAAAWRDERGVAGTAVTPFCDLEPHDLRATAATLMRDAGFTREQAAARLGHADSGKLLDRIYDQGDRRARMRQAIDTFAPAGLRALAGPPPRRSITPAATRPALTERLAT
jgi:integrase